LELRVAAVVGAATDYDPEGAYYLGLLFSEGRIAVSDVLTAQTQTTKTPPLTLKKGKPGLPDHHRAFRLWTIAADRGHVDAQHRLGWLHFNGDLSSCQQVELVEGQPWSGPPGSKWSQSYQTLQWGPDVPTAIKLWTDLAQKGHLDSQLTLGKLYSNASAGSLDYQAAVKWYEEAAALGHLDSQCTLGDLYSTNKLGAPDFAAAAKWYTGAAELGHAKSQINLGKLHRDGHLGPPDYQAALKWFTKATEQGDAEGQFQTGLLHQHHLNSPDLDPNFDEACAWYRKAAEQGHVESQATLGIGYEEGTFISTDPDEPRHWLTKAAEQGHARAQFHLGQLYFAQDTAASDRMAAKWFLKAGRQGVPSARLFLTAAVNSRGARRQNNEDVGPDISDSEA
jgi:TPR repeat protein